MYSRVGLHIFMTIGVVVLFAIPLLSSAETSSFPGVDRIVPECGTVSAAGEFDPCTFCDFKQLVQNLLNFALFLSILTAGALFAYAGWLFVTAQGNSGQVGRAKKLFLDVFIGFVVVMSAYVIVDTLMKMLAGGSFTTSWSDLCPIGDRVSSGYGGGYRP